MLSLETVLGCGLGVGAKNFLELFSSHAVLQPETAAVMGPYH